MNYKDKIGFSSYILAPLSWKKCLKFAIKNDFKFLELMYEYPQIPNENQIKEIKNLSKENDINLNMHGPMIGNDLGCIEENIRKTSIDNVKRCIDMANKINISFITIHSGYRPFSSPKNSITKVQRNIQKDAWVKTFKLVKDSLREIIEYANYNEMITVCLENMDSEHAYVKSPKDFKNIGIKKLYFTFDSGHAFVNNYSIKDFIDVVGRKIKIIHLNDNDGNIDYHKQLGKGKVDFFEIFNEITKINFEGPLIIETQAGMYKSITKSRNYILNIIKRVNNNNLCTKSCC